METNYKNKYHALRMKFMESVDMAFRLGYEQGMKDAQMDQMQQMQEQAAQAEANAQANGEEGGEGEEGQEQQGQEGQEGQEQEGQEGAEGGEEAGGEAPPGAEGAQPGQPPMAGAAPAMPGIPQSMGPEMGGSELDSHITTLESMLGKPAGEQSPADQEAIAKSLTAIKSFRKNQLLAIELQKSEVAIKGIAKALKQSKKPISAANKMKYSAIASHNLGSNAKKALSLQEKIVNDVMKSWAEEEKNAKNKLTNILSVEGLTKKE